MLKMGRGLKFILLLTLWLVAPAFGGEPAQQQILTIPAQIALPIGVKIWFNESGGSVMGLTSWNQGENFASLGIGHFIWYPANGKSSGNDGFPRLLRYMETHGVSIPWWLRSNNGQYCPWHTRNEFLQAQYSQRMVDLRRFLQQTIPIQAEYMTHHLEEIFPDMLASTPPEERPYICQQFYTLARTPAGVYALVDFLNFKGSGIGNSARNYNHGTGLLQVLKGMRNAPAGSTPLQAYVWSAKNTLIRRVENQSPQTHAEKWVAGWFKRLNTYLEGDLGPRVAIN
jgi:hypothetical protein